MTQSSFGKKTGEGFYLWRDDKPQKPPAQGSPPPDLQDRLILSLVNEASRHSESRSLTMRTS